jgi:hyperosmotically inducible periplasmic protein
MSTAKWLLSAALVCVVGTGVACTQNAADQPTNAPPATALDEAKTGTDKAAEATKEGVGRALDATKEGAGKAIDETAKAVEKTADVTKDAAQTTGDKTKEIASATGEVITDGWITTTVSARFVDEALLKGSNINVDTSDHVVTLKGTVGSDAARARAAEIATGTKGVARVVNQLVVKVK